MKKTLLAVVLWCAAAAGHGAEEIRFWHAMSGPVGEEFDRLVARFNASQPQYRVVSSFQGPYDAVLADEIAVRKGTGGSPHIVQVQESATADMMRSGAARPLWQVLQESGQRLDARFLPAVATSFSDPEERLLALPFNVSTPVLYFNRDAFRKAKLDPSSPPKTWYEMPAALAALLESGQPCALTTAWPSWVLLENMSAWHNQAFATQDNGMAGGDARLSFNRRLMVRWISVLSSWQKSGYFTYAGRGDQAEARFASGECALLTSSSASYSQLRKAAPFELGVAQFPYYDDFDDAPQNTLIQGSGLWLIAGLPANEYKGAARFLAYISAVDVQATWHQRTGHVPTTLPAYELTRRQGFYKANPGHEIAVRQLLLKAPTNDSKGIRLAEFRRIRSIIDEELEGVWDGSKTPLDALNAAVRRGNEVLEKLRQRSEGDPR